MFVVQSYPRCGTHYLRTAINSHGAALCYAEIFNPTWQVSRAMERPPSFVKTPEQVVAWCASCRVETGFVAHNYVGLPAAIEGPGITPQFRARGDVAAAQGLWGLIPLETPVVTLHRNNLLARYVSERIAALRDWWTVYTDQPAPPDLNLRVDVAVMLEDFERTETLHRAACRRFDRVLEVSYEYLTGQPEVALPLIQKFIGLEVRELRPATVKVGRPLAQCVENWSEVQDALRGTRWEYLLELPE